MGLDALAAAQIQIGHGDADHAVAQKTLWRRRHSSSVCVRGDAALRVLFGDWIVMGLDALAAAQIQFRPATQNGLAVDQTAVIRVRFQLAN